MPRRWDWEQYQNIGGIGAREAREARQAVDEFRPEPAEPETPAVREESEPKVGPAIHHPNVVMRAPAGAYEVGQRVTVEVGRRHYGRLVEQYELEVVSLEDDEKDPNVKVVALKRVVPGEEAAESAESESAAEPVA